MGISITITGDKFASVIGDMQDFIDGGNFEINAPDFETSDEPNIPVPAKRRGRKPKAAAPAAEALQTVTATPPMASGPATSAPAAAAPSTGTEPQIAPAAAALPAATGAVTAGTLGPEAVAPGGVVFLAVKAYNDKHGMEKARALLLEFGCGMVRQIKPEQYAAVIAKCAE